MSCEQHCLVNVVPRVSVLSIRKSLPDQLVMHLNVAERERERERERESTCHVNMGFLLDHLVMHLRDVVHVL
jgi:hypothetical protein